MGIKITDGVFTAPVAVVPAEPVGTMKINGVDRETRTLVVGGKTVVHTVGLSFEEEWEVERVMSQKDMGGPGTMRAFAMATVRQIDGASFGMPVSESDIKGVLRALGDAAARAVYRAYIANLGKVEAEAKNG